MNYDKIIIEMLGRIQALEEKVSSFMEKDAKKNEEAASESKESGRTLARLEIIKILGEKFGLNARIGNRTEGSGVVVTSKQGKLYNIKLFYSRSYPDYVNNVICAGWHTLYEKEIDNDGFSFFIFVVGDTGRNYHYFIFKREDITKEFDYKVYDANRALHFYFRVKNDGSPVELREKERDMRAFYNNWDIFAQLMH
jgi:hypothetical protein